MHGERSAPAAGSVGDAVTARLRAAGCVFAEEEAALLLTAAAGAEALAAMVAERVTGTPLEHVLGWAEFCGRRVAVHPGVFVPRRRTEFLVERALDLAGGADVVVELCCGSAAVALVLARSLPGARVHACDVDPAAVDCARANLAGVGGHVHQGDLFAALPGRLRGRIDLAVANAPYVPTERIALMPREAREHEPRVALDGGGDGADVHRRIAAAAPRWLAPGGRLLVETGAAQAELTARAFGGAGLEVHAACREDDGTVVLTGVLPPAPRRRRAVTTSPG